VGLWSAGRPRPATAASLWTGETPGARRSIGDREIVKIKVEWIGKTKEPAIQALTDEYLKRIRRYAEVAGLALKDEAAILSLATGERQKKKERHKLVLVDSRGKQLSSEELAEFVEREQVNATPLLFAIGGSDGFSDEARRYAGFTLSLGKMTLPHELARVVLVEQLYRAFTILSNHPYHLGH
jgi:23S rRNA (pseudouridine1915-N3)-methyltransferase